MKNNRFVLDGNAMMSGEDMKVNCSRLFIYTAGEDIEKIGCYRQGIRFY